MVKNEVEVNEMVAFRNQIVDAAKIFEGDQNVR